MKKALVQRCLGILTLLFIASTPLSHSQENFIFIENFENYQDNKAIQKAYTVWADGAVLNTSTLTYPDTSSNKTMKVEIISPNPDNQSSYGSIYHVLAGNSRNWSDSTALRFWINNLDSEPLLLSFNFKEAYNENWAIADQGIYFLQNNQGDLLQQEIEYDNIPVEADYQGWILVPFSSFEVPTWNTARGNNIMDLKRIESFAFSISIEENYPRSFLIDNIEIFSHSKFWKLDISGSKAIQIPESGEHHEQYSAILVSPENDVTEQIDASWALQYPNDAEISIDQNGVLVVPSGIDAATLFIAATYNSEDNLITKIIEVELSDSYSLTANVNSEETPSIPKKKPTVSVYDQFSQNFEVWAVENRLLFVILSVAVVLLVVFLLTVLQHRLK